MDENTKIDLTLTVQQINVILGTLGEAPFRVAQPLITAIQQQAQAQLEGSAPELVEAEKVEAKK